MKDIELPKLETLHTSKAFKKLSRNERHVMLEIMSLDQKLKQNQLKQVELASKIERLKRKYVSAFRMRNPDLRHFKT